MSEVPSIEIRVPFGTPLKEIIALVMEQAWRIGGTQLKGAVALDITPETLCKTLRRRKLARSEDAQTLETAPGSVRQTADSPRTSGQGNL